MQIHEKNEYPNPYDYGVALVPGTMNSISLTARNTHLLSSPYGSNCTNRDLPNTSYRYDYLLSYTNLDHWTALGLHRH